MHQKPDTLGAHIVEPADTIVIETSPEEAVEARRLRPAAMHVHGSISIERALIRSESVIHTILTGAHTHAHRIGAKQARYDIGMGVMVAMDDPAVVAELEAHAVQSVSGISRTTRTALRTYIAAAVEAGKTPTQIARGIARMFDDFSELRALTIARTETAYAYIRGSNNAVATMVRAGVPVEKAWLVVDPEDWSCIEAGETGWVPFHTIYDNGLQAPPAHPNCMCDLTYRRGK